MHKTAAALAFLLLTSACASMKSDSGLGPARSADVVEPAVQIVQLSRMPGAARHITGGIPIQYGVRITNRASHPILLTRVTVVSMGEGAYNLAQSSHPFKIWIQPAGYGDVQFWAPASIDSATISGANGPVTVRATLTFDSSIGQFEKIVVQQVNEFGVRRGEGGR